jgi:HTH-type transcriptional regulator / antitoxin HigA
MPLSASDHSTPGQFVNALLKERGWSQTLLGVVLGKPSQFVSEIVRDKRQITADTALELSEVFGYDAADFLGLQQKYDLAHAAIRRQPDPSRAARARLYGDLPLAAMAKRGWIDVGSTKDVEQVDSELTKFFGVRSFSEIQSLPHAAKRSNAAMPVTDSQLAWLHRVRQIAREMVVPAYATSALSAAIREMKHLLISPEGVRRAPRLLAEAGVRFVVVESLPGAKIDGVCFWLDDASPVIGMTLRYDRIDNFWFVLRHECEHVLRGDGRDAPALDVELERERTGAGEDVEEQERIANSAAADFCVSSEKLRQFIARKNPVFTVRDIHGFAKLQQVHPGLVAGQLQRATGHYDRFRDLLASVRSIVLPNVVHDGWGDVAHVGA